MKKLMIAAAIVCAAALSHGAAMTWASADQIVDPTGYTPCGDYQVTMYMWSINEATYNDLTKNGADKVSAAVWAKYGSLENPTKSAVEEEGSLALKDSKTYSQYDTAYAAVIFTYDPDGSGVTHYIANAGEWTFATASDKTQFNMDKFVGGGTSGTAVTWQTVPEPTSGLLLLLGVAGLALRRRRA